MGRSSGLPYHVNCVHDGGTFPTQPNGSGGGIFVVDCRAGCDIAEARAKVAARTEFVDPVPPGQGFVTASEEAPSEKYDDMVRLIMATVWDSPAGGKIVFASFDARPSDIAGVQNMMRSIYESAHDD